VLSHNIFGIKDLTNEKRGGLKVVAFTMPIADNEIK
jgi:hypothetical protein